MPRSKFWLVVGIPENWFTAFDYQCIWGLKNHQQNYWESITENSDLVFFYVTSPVSGIIGYGLVREKLQQLSPLWPEERAKNQVIWPLRFYFDVRGALRPDLWEEQRVTSDELKRRARSGFQSIDVHLAQEILQALPNTVPEDLVLTSSVAISSPARASAISRRAPAVSNQHEQAQHFLVEIGRLQKFVAEAEFPLENRRLDVAWRRVQRSVPSYVFEVQVGGNLTEAMGKLKHAFSLWNSNIFLVARQEHRAAANQLIAGTFHEIRDRLRFAEVGQVEELYNRKRAYRELETQMGILA